MRWLYQPLYLALLVVAAPFLLLARGAHYVPTLKSRFFGPRRRPSAAESLWMHAVSVGESGVAAVLARHLPTAGRLTMTTVTPTGQRTAAEALGGRIDLTYLPFDLFWAVYRFLDWARPRGAVLIEGDYWPFLLGTLRRRQIPVYVVNGRLSDRSFGRLKLLPKALTRAWFRPVSRFGVQSAQDRERFVALGVPAEDVEVTGNLKFDQQPAEPDPQLVAAVRDLAAGRSILVAGSTMEDEEGKVLQAFDGLGERAILLLAPRHPERAPAVRDLAVQRGFRVAMRSRIDVGEDLASSRGPDAPNHPGRAQGPPLQPESTATDASSTTDHRPLATGHSTPDVVILDTIGELAGLYSLATSAFVGGTLVPTGGHNPLEPAAHAVPIVAGPSMHNFRAIAEEFDRARAWRLVDSAGELTSVWRQWLDEPAVATGFGARARHLLEQNRGAVEATIDLLEPLIDRWQNGHDDA